MAGPIPRVPCWVLRPAHSHFRPLALSHGSASLPLSWLLSSSDQWPSSKLHFFWLMKRSFIHSFNHYFCKSHNWKKTDKSLNKLLRLDLWMWLFMISWLWLFFFHLYPFFSIGLAHKRNPITFQIIDTSTYLGKRRRAYYVSHYNVGKV